MSQFIESIKIFDGEYFCLDLHQERVNTVFELFYPGKEAINLRQILQKEPFAKCGLYKCRIVYGSIIKTIEFQPYHLPIINSLKLVELDEPTTVYKSLNRANINNVFEKRAGFDDVLLYRKNLITDTSYCNVAFFDGTNWVTPAVPLIYGTKRKQLLRKNIISEDDIKVTDLNHFQSICLFNAMIEFGEIIIPVEKIK